MEMEMQMQVKALDFDFYNGNDSGDITLFVI